MQIHRDYSQSIFTHRKRRSTKWWRVLILLALIAGFVFFVDRNFYTLQSATMDMIGMAPEPTPVASYYAEQALTRFQRGNTLAAAQAFEQAIQQQPDNIDYLYEYGRMLLEMGVDNRSHYERALEIGDIAIQTDPNNPRGYVIKMRALDALGRPQDAVPVGQAGLNVDRGFASLYAGLSSAYRNTDRYELALEFGARAVELDPTDPVARRIYALALNWVGQRQQAIAQLEQAVALNPSLAGSSFELANMYRSIALNSADPEEIAYYSALALDIYERIIAQQPENARAFLRLCEAYFERREMARSADHCTNALNINPTYAQAWASLGQAEYSQTRFTQAITAFDQCVANQGTDIRCYTLRGLAHYYIGDCDQAWVILSEALGRIQQITTNPQDYRLSTALEGISLVSSTCPGYSGRTVPNLLVPTATIAPEVTPEATSEVTSGV